MIYPLRELRIKRIKVYFRRLSIDPDFASAYNDFFGLSLIRFLNESAGETFSYPADPYEQGSDKPAIEILTGDCVLLDFPDGKMTAEVSKIILKYQNQNGFISLPII